MKNTLEKITNSIKRNTKKAIVTTLIPFMIGGSVKANPGYLTIENNLNSNTRNVNLNRNDSFFNGAMDGHDIYDSEANTQPNGFPNIVSDIITHNLWSDVRAENSVADYDLRLSFSGSLSSTQPNTLNFSFPYDSEGDYEFNGQEVLFQSDALPFGSVVDVRRAIAENGGDVSLKDVPVGTTGEYASGILTIGTRRLADLNDDGKVDIHDFAELSRDYGKTNGQYVSDISGPNGIPDGNVDGHDLSAFAQGFGE